MKILFLILLLVSFLQADFNIGAKSTTWATNISKTLDGEEVGGNEMITTNLQINTDYTYDDFYIQSTVFMYTYETADGEKLHNMNFYDDIPKQDIFFRSLYTSYKINNNFTAGIGALPFSNSAPLKYNDDYIQDGVGINILNDNTVTSIFIKHDYEGSSTIFGYGTIDDILVPIGDYIDPVLREGTTMFFLINTYEKDKFTLTSELLYIDMKYETKDLADIYLAGVNLSWDDSEESGWSIYGSIGASMYKNNNTDAKQEIFAKTLGDRAAYGDYIMAQYPDNFAINNDTYYGGSHLLGVRKDFSISKEEFFINGEWFHTYGDWSSGNQGNIYVEKQSQIFNVRDNSYYLNLGYIINQKALIRFTYNYLELDGAGKIGAPASTVPVSDYIGKRINKIEAYGLSFSYKF